MQLVPMLSSGGQSNKGATTVQRAVRGTNTAPSKPKTMNEYEFDAVSISKTGRNLFDMEKVIAKLREYAKWGNYKINYSLDDKTGSLVVRIVDSDTGEVTRQIPPEEILALRSHLQKLIEEAFAESA
jgi:flagellar protein FlaG